MIRLFWMCLVAVVLVAVLYMMVHRILINRATIMLRKQAQSVTDAAVNDCFHQLLGWDKSIDSQLVADVWGKGVLAFEYHFPAADLGTVNKAALQQALDDYATRHQVKVATPGAAAFVITDWWQYEQVHHVDVAYLLNEATREYVADLRRIDH